MQQWRPSTAKINKYKFFLKRKGRIHPQKEAILLPQHWQIPQRRAARCSKRIPTRPSRSCRWDLGTRLLPPSSAQCMSGSSWGPHKEVPASTPLLLLLWLCLLPWTPEHALVPWQTWQPDLELLSFCLEPRILIWLQWTLSPKNGKRRGRGLSWATRGSLEPEVMMLKSTYQWRWPLLSEVL